MKNLILIFTLLSVFFVWSCDDDDVIYGEGWSSSAREWETKVGYYRGQLEIEVDGLPMDTMIQQVALDGDNYDRVNLRITDVTINDEYYGGFYLSELSFKEENGVIHIKGKQNNQNITLGLISIEIEGEIKNDVFTFDMAITGLETLDLRFSMKSGRLVEEFPNDDCSIEKIVFQENASFLTGTPTIYGGAICFYVADSLTTTDSTFFSVGIKELELASGAWIEPDTTKNWTMTHNHESKGAPSIATTDSLYRFSEKIKNRYIKVWAADSINYQEYQIRYEHSNATKISLFHWEASEIGPYMEPIAGWASNNAYIHQLLGSSTISNNSMYITRVLGKETGDIGARMETEVIGTVADSSIKVIAGKLFRGQFDLDSIDTPKNGEFHGITFNKRKPVSLSGYYRYIPGEVLHIGDSIVPDSVLVVTDSCYIEAFLYAAVDSDAYLDSLYISYDPKGRDPRVIGYAKFAGGIASEYRQFSMRFDVRNWVSSRRYHLGIVCSSSGKDRQRIGASGSVLYVSGFELMSTGEYYIKNK